MMLTGVALVVAAMTPSLPLFAIALSLTVMVWVEVKTFSGAANVGGGQLYTV